MAKLAVKLIPGASADRIDCRDVEPEGRTVLKDGRGTVRSAPFFVPDAETA